MVYTGFGKRAIAFLIDGLILFLFNFVFITIFAFLPFSFILPVASALFYSWIFLSSPLQSTPGRILMNFKIVKEDGRSLNIVDVLLRTFMAYLSNAFLFFGYVLSLFTQKRQTLHDLVARTVAVEQSYDYAEAVTIFKVYVIRLIKSQDEKENIKGDILDAEYTEIKSYKAQDMVTIEELYQLYQKGILTQEEYERKRDELLNSFKNK